MVAKLSKQELIRFNQELFALVRSGLPLPEGLSQMARESEGRLKKFMLNVHQNLQEGKSLAASLESQKDRVEDYYIALVKAGEESGNLEATLQEVIKGYQRSLQVDQTIVSGVRYPAFIFLLFLGILAFISATVAPKLAEIYYQMTRQSPITTGTQIIFSLCGFYRENLVWIAMAIGLVVIYVVYFWVTRRKVPLLGDVIFYIPVIGRIAYYNFAIVFCRNLAHLLKAGVGLSNALRLLQGSFAHRREQKKVRAIEKRVEKGAGFGESLEKVRCLPASSTWAIKMAEDRGDLETILLDLAGYYEERYQDLDRELHQFLMPILLLILGIIIGIIVIYLFLPIVTIPKLIR